MTKLATRSAKLSGVIAFEDNVDKGYCRKVATVTVEAGMDVGAVLQLSAGKYIWVTAAAVASLATDVVVLVDGYAGVPTAALTPGDYQLVVMHRGPAGVATGGLKFKGTALSSGQLATVYAALEAKGIAVRTAV